jgi:hypothetical protein
VSDDCPACHVALLIPFRALLVAQRGVVCESFTLTAAVEKFPLTTASVFRKQYTFSIEDQRALGSRYGPLHVHPTYAVPRRGNLDDVVGGSPSLRVAACSCG